MLRIAAVVSTTAGSALSVKKWALMNISGVSAPK